MGQYRAFFIYESIKDSKDFLVTHNCNGSLGFTAKDIVDETVARLIELAIEEGKRRRSKAINKLLSNS